MTEQQLEQVREKIVKILQEPDVRGYDWNMGSSIILNWKAGLPDQILNITIQIPCKECGGRKQVWGNKEQKAIKCPPCKGTGYKEVTIKEMIENE